MEGKVREQLNKILLNKYYKMENESEVATPEVAVEETPVVETETPIVE